MASLQAALAELTPEQRSAVEHPGNFLLQARPGSGKTRIVGLRLAHAALAGVRPVAVASYTNVAVDEVLGVCRSVGAAAASRNYVGTLHGLLIDYVLKPHGHIVCKCRGPIRVRETGWSGGKSRKGAGWPNVLLGEKNVPLSVAHFHFDRTGTAKCLSTPEGFHYFTADRITELGSEPARQLKLASARGGIVSQSDALYWSLEVLRARPRLAHALAGRFSEIMVDEAQDTSDVQLACLELLRATEKLRSLVLIADLEQSIYGFQGADPTRLERFAADAGLDGIELTYNFRSSQRICDVASGFTRRSPDKAAGPNAHFDAAPEVFRFPDDDARHALSTYRNRLDTLGLSAEASAVLARSRRLRDELNGMRRVECNRLATALGSVAACLELGEPPNRAAVARLETTILWLVTNDRQLDQLSSDQRQRLRTFSVRLLRQLPRFGALSLAEWLAACRPIVNRELNSFVVQRTDLANQPSALLKDLPSLRSVTAREQFAPTARALQAQTVHAVKGRSLESVLLVVESRAGKRDPARLLCSVDEHGSLSPEDQEELRIGFVSVTRAEKYCAVALPDSVPEEVVKRYADMGFKLI